MLDFRATWCGGCKEEGWKSVKPFLAERRVNYTIVVGEWDDMATRFGFDQLPVTLLIDREGRIADSHIGMIDKDTFEKEIQILLKETASAKPAS